MTSLLRSLLPARQSRSISTVDDYLSALGVNGYYGGIDYATPGLTGTWPQQAAERIPNDFEGFARNAFGQNSIVFGCMSLRMSVFSAIRFSWQRLNTDKPSELFGSRDLALLENPWPGGTTQDLLARIIQDADLAGNSYWTVHDGHMVRMRPDWVQIAMEPRVIRGAQVGWRKLGHVYWEGGIGVGEPVAFLLGEVAHFAPTPDPLATFRGMSWLTPVLREITNDKAMVLHQEKFFQNAAVPNLSVSLDKDIKHEAFAKFKDAMNENHTGVRNWYKCLHPDTDVAMWDGRRVPARAVAAGDLVVSWADGRPVPGTVSAAEWQPSSPIVTVTTQRGRVIRTNDRHPFLVGDQWVDAEHLRPGDLLTTGLGWGYGGGASDLTDHDAWLLGALTGDGCMVMSTPVISAWDEGIRARCGRFHELRWTGKGHDYRLLGITKLAHKHGLMGARSWEKRIPTDVMTAPISVRAAFISGLIDTDGHLSNPAAQRSMTLNITSVSRELLADAQHLLASLGVNTSISQCAAPGKYSVRGAWRLHAFGNAQARRLVELLDLACAMKRDRLAQFADTVPMNRRDSSRVDRVASVEITEPEPTIGIEIAEHHTHVTGGVVTHNTLFLGGGADVKVIGADFQQMDFKRIQGAIESRIAAAAGVPPMLTGLAEGMRNTNHAMYSAARRRFADGTISPLWQNVAGSLATLVSGPPKGAPARLWFDGRDVPFLREDRTDAAEIMRVQAGVIRSLIEAGYEPDSVVRAVEAEDMSLLVGRHSGLTSVQLQPPVTAGTSVTDSPGSDIEPINSKKKDDPAGPSKSDYEEEGDD